MPRVHGAITRVLDWIKDKINAIRRGTGIGSKDDLDALEKAQKLWQDMYDVATARQNEKVTGKGDKRFDKQGNPVDGDGKLIVEKTNSVDELSDDDFTNPSRSVELPKIPDNVDKAIGANGKPVIIKKNIFEKNKANHPELKPSQSKMILGNALYSTNLYGQTQPLTRPNYWVVIQTSDPNKVAVLEVSEKKDNIEIVGWRYAGERQLEELRKQSEREDGQLLILTSDKEAAAGLSTLPSDVSAFKDTDSSANPQEKIGESGLVSDEERVQKVSEKDKQETEIIFDTAKNHFGTTNDMREAAVHEYSHLWAQALRKGNAEEWRNVTGLMKDSPVWDEVRELYPELRSEDEIAEEVLSLYSGRKGAEREADAETVRLRRTLILLSA